MVTIAGSAAALLTSVRSRANGNAAPAHVELTDDDPVAIVLTSGTTGRPKGAWFTNRQLRAVTTYDLGPDGLTTWGGGGPMLASTQFAHVGFMTKLPWYLRLGTTLHLLGRWRAADVLDLVERTGMTSVGGVAPQFALMLRDPRFDERDLSSVKALVVGGGPSSPALVEEACRRFDAAYSIRYSSTESGGVGTGTAFDAPDDEALHTVGRPRPGMGLEIRDEAGRTLPPRRGRRGVPAVGCGDVGLLERSRRQRRGASATAGCTPPTWGSSTPRGAWCWPAASRRCSSGVGTTCTRWRSRRCSSSTPACARWPWCPAPTT